MNKDKFAQELMLDTGVYYEWVEWYKDKSIIDTPDSTVEWFYNELEQVGVSSSEQNIIVDEWLIRAYYQAKDEVE